MRRLVVVATLVAALAAVPALALRTGAPPGATAQCRDGSYSFSLRHSGTCSHHGGVARWLDGSTSSTARTTIGGRGSTSCGVERQAVKTLQDRPRLLPPVRTTVRYLVSRPEPLDRPSTRLQFERHVFTVTAGVELIREEADDDLHVVLTSDGRTMIAEATAAACDTRAVPFRRRQIAAARSHVEPCIRARVTGVAFFDFPHGQTGVAPNAIELHPILALRCVSSSG